MLGGVTHELLKPSGLLYMYMHLLHASYLPSFRVNVSESNTAQKQLANQS